MQLETIFKQQQEANENAYASVKKQDDEVYLISFNLRNNRFAIPITQIKEIVDTIPITPFPIENNFFMGVVNLHGYLVPVLDSKKLVHEYVDDETQLNRMIVCENLQNNMFIVSAQSIKKIAAPNELINENKKIFSRVIKLGDEVMQLLDFRSSGAIDLFIESTKEIA